MKEANLDKVGESKLSQYLESTSSGTFMMDIATQVGGVGLVTIIIVSLFLMLQVKFKTSPEALFSRSQKAKGSVFRPGEIVWFLVRALVFFGLVYLATAYLKDSLEGELLSIVPPEAGLIEKSDKLEFVSKNLSIVSKVFGMITLAALVVSSMAWFRARFLFEKANRMSRAEYEEELKEESRPLLSRQRLGQ